MNVGNPFIPSDSRSNFEYPFAHLPLAHEKQLIENSSQPLGLPSEEPLLNVINELQKLNLALDDYIVHLSKKGLANYSFHIIVTPTRVEDLIAPLDNMDQLEIEPLDIRQHPERVAQAIQNQAFVALKTKVKPGKKLKAKFAPKMADWIERGKIKQLKLINPEGEVKEKIELKEAQVTYFTAAEVDHISTVIFKAIDISYQIRALEQQQLQQQRKQDQQDMENRQKRYQEEQLVERFRELLETVEKRHKEQLEEDKKVFIEAANCLASSDTFIRDVIERQTEEVKEQKAIEKQKNKKDRIIKEDIEKFELQTETIKRDHQIREIKQSE